MDYGWLIEIAKILIPALGAWLAIYLSNRNKRESEKRDQYTAGWSQMTAQSREIINDLQNEVVSLRTKVGVTEERLKETEEEKRELEEEMEELRKSFEDIKREYAFVTRELETIKATRSRRKES